ncbi:recombinase family protein, partial [Clostridioides difficile]
MNNRIDAIYARQSVDKKDSISIESQIEFCKYELKGGNCKEYTDKGYSGKNTDRPKFQELVRDIKRGLIAKVVVYKLDRISRSILDFANMMELFQQYNVEFVSSTEKFDTSTPMGRAMLNICIVFAQLERETIQKRVTDAYYSRSQRGFKMGGKAPYGFHTEPIKMDGINTKKLVVNPDEAANIRLMFEMYAQPTTSYGDITRYFAEQGILFNGKELIRPTLAQMLRNPVYVQADLDVYEFFKSQGTIIVNDAADFTGTNGCYLYQGRDVKPSKKNDLKDQMLVLAPHEGIVPADIWLACRKKLMNNMKIQSARKATHTWLAGKIKCGNCGYALMSI